MIELLFKALEVAKYKIINYRNKSIQLQYRVLQRSGCQEDLLAMVQCVLDSVGGLVSGLIHISKPMCLINDNKIPFCVAKIRSL